ncbi:MAG: hypothetical protein PWR24_194 [Desulfonauticus sp.]|jgi:ArsR family transcriptional regulator|nr:MAG: Transcriptional regulator, ArsR family [Desulfonauticus sp. 38_4375]MDK2920637.1 hypothetical protein [Desulfonauticus sp.]
MKKIVKIFKAVSDANRLKILGLLLKKKEVCVCEFQQVLEVAQPTVSKHLKILEEAGFIESRRQGSWMIYFLPLEMEAKNKQLVDLLARWLEEEKEIQDLAKLLPNLREKE